MCNAKGENLEIGNKGIWDNCFECGTTLRVDMQEGKDWFDIKNNGESFPICRECKEKGEKGKPTDYITKEQFLDNIQQFTGTENYYNSTFKKLQLTDGIHYLREKLNCYWLIDIIESVQELAKIKDNSCFIVWKIEVQGDKSFKVTAWNDTPYKSQLLYEQKGKYTDLILDDFEFYQENNVLLLKTEH